MVCFGAIRVQRDLEKAPWYYGKTAPLIGATHIPAALAISGITHEEHKEFPPHPQTMASFNDWITKTNEKGRPIFVSDNPAWDYQWINWYFVDSGIPNPFGHSGRRIGDFYAGLKKDFTKASEWKRLRKTKHTHNPVDDARGNAEALVSMCDQFNIRLSGVNPLFTYPGTTACAAESSELPTYTPAFTFDLLRTKL
jgi:hypothetical protein